jgi:hypothetical protein
MKSMDKVCKINVSFARENYYLHESVGFISDTATDAIVTAPPASIVRENVGLVTLTVGLIQGNICGEIEIGFEVSNSNRSFTATGIIFIIIWCMNLHKSHSRHPWGSLKCPDNNL